MKKSVKIISIILSLVILTMSVFSVGCVANAEEILKEGKYYVGNSYFNYYISDNMWAGNIGTEFSDDTTLYITSFSEDFSRKVTVPDEIEGIKIKNVVIVAYECIETLVLSDGIKTFACFDEQEDDWLEANEKYEEPNSIKYLYLGKEFSENGMFYCQEWGSPYGAKLKELRNIYVSEENPNLTAVDGILYSKDLKRVIMVPEKNRNVMSKKDDVYIKIQATEIGSRAYQYTKYYKNLDKKRITYIGSKAFAETSLRSVTLYGKTKYVGEYAFWGCNNLKKVTIKGNTEKEIGIRAFAGCKKLKKVVIDSKVIPKFRREAFQDGVKFYVKSKKLAKELKTAIEKAKGIKNADIYVKNKLVFDM